VHFLQVFHDVAYKARDRYDLLAGVDEFLDCVTVLPPGEWDPTIRIEPPKNVPSQVTILSSVNRSNELFLEWRKYWNTTCKFTTEVLSIC